MRPIWLVQLDKVRPALLLTRQEALRYLASVTVAPITSTVRNKRFEVPVGPGNGLDHDSVINLDTITSVSVGALIREIGVISEGQEDELVEALAFCWGLAV